MKLTLALKMARQDLTRTQMELNTMKASFGDVVPRRDFEVQEKTNKDLQEQLNSLRDDYKEVCREHEILLQLHMSTVKERDQFYSELQELQRTSTPRPNWAKCEGTGGLWGPRTCSGVWSRLQLPLPTCRCGGWGPRSLANAGQRQEQ